VLNKLIPYYYLLLYRA